MTEISDLLTIVNRIEGKVDEQGTTIADIRVSMQDLCNRTGFLEKEANDMIQAKIKENNELQAQQRKKGDNTLKLIIAAIGAMSGIPQVLTYLKVHF